MPRDYGRHQQNMFFSKVFSGFSMQPSPKSLKICSFLFQPKGLPKGQMVAMTIKALKSRPTFGLCFRNIQLTYALLWSYVNIHITYIFVHGICIAFDICILAYLYKHLIIAIPSMDLGVGLFELYNWLDIHAYVYTYVYLNCNVYASVCVCYHT